MFEWLNKQGVKSEKGFIVQVVDRFVIEYREKNKVISVEVEPEVLPNGKVFITFKKYAFSKWDDGTSISEEKQKEILKNFTDAMAFQNIGVIVEN